MKTLLCGCAALTLAFGLANAASATVINFDDLGSFQAIGNGYAGLDWSNFYVLSGNSYSGTGYQTGTVSAPNVAFNAYGAPASVSTTATDGFTLNSVDMTAAWGDQTVFVNGLTTGGQALSASFATVTTGPILATFNWSHVASLTFSTNYAQFAMDNLTINASSPAPEPASWALMLGGFGAIGGALRARRKAAVHFA